jgi:hypothetical protein
MIESLDSSSVMLGRPGWIGPRGSEMGKHLSRRPGSAIDSIPDARSPPGIDYQGKNGVHDIVIWDAPAA